MFVYFWIPFHGVVMLEMTCRGLCYSVSFFQTPHPDHYFINVGEFRKDQKADLCDDVIST